MWNNLMIHRLLDRKAVSVFAVLFTVEAVFMQPTFSNHDEDGSCQHLVLCIVFGEIHDQQRKGLIEVPHHGVRYI
jgi:hypothetical protein